MALTRTTTGRFFDSFSGTLSAWTQDVGSWAIVGGKVSTGSTTADTTMHVPQSYGDVYVEAAIGEHDPNKNHFVCARWNDISNVYLVWHEYADASTARIHLYKRVAGAFAEVGAGATVSFAAGTRLGIKVVGTGAATRLTAYKNGVAITGLVDVDPAVSAGVLSTGYPALRVANNAGSGNETFDDFTAHPIATTITITGLSSGYKAAISGGAKFTESGGTATITGLTAGTSYTVQVFNGSDVQQGADQTGVYPGDSWAFTPDIVRVAEAAGEASAPTVSAVVTSPSKILVRREGTTARIRFVTDPLVEFATHKMYRNGSLVADIGRGCNYVATGDTPGDVYTVQAHNGTALVGTVFQGVSLAAPTLTLGAITADSVALSWSAVSGASYKVCRRPYRSTLSQGEVVYTGSALEYTDAEPIDGYSLYWVEAVYASGESWSAEVEAHVARTRYISPNERGLTIRSNPSLGTWINTDNYGNKHEHEVGYVEDNAQVLWATRNLPLTQKKIGQSTRDWLLGIISGGVPLAGRVLADNSQDWGFNSSTFWGANTPSFSASTGQATFDDIAMYAQLFAKGAPAHLELRSSPYEWDTTLCADLRFGYKVGSTVTMIAAFDSCYVSYDGINGKAVYTLVSNGNITYTITIGKVVTIKATGGTPVIKDYAHTGDSNVVNYDGTTYRIRAWKSFLWEPRTHGSLAHYSATGTWTWSANATSSDVTFAEGETLRVQVGQDHYPIYSGYDSPSDAWTLGGSLINGRVILGLAAWCKKHPTDSTAIATLASLADAMYTHVSSMDYVTQEKGFLLYAYAVLANLDSGNTTYSTRKSALITATAGAAQGEVAIGRAEAGQTYLGASGGSETFSRGLVWFTRSNKQDSEALLKLSELLRCNWPTTPTQYIVNDSQGNLVATWGTTGEATAYFMGMLSDIRSSNGDITPIRIGRTPTVAGSKNNSDGTISGYSYASNVFTITVDSDIWLYTGSRGKPTSVKRGTTTLTETSTDPGTSAMTADTWFFDDTINVLKVGVTATGAAIAATFAPMTGVALSTSSVDSAGCNLDWSFYTVSDFISYRIYRSIVPDAITNGMLLGTVTEFDTNSFHDSTADRGTAYYYAVMVDTTGIDLASNEIMVTTAIQVTDASGDALAPSATSTEALPVATATADAIAPVYRTSPAAVVAAAAGDAMSPITRQFSAPMPVGALLLGIPEGNSLALAIPDLGGLLLTFGDSMGNFTMKQHANRRPLPCNITNKDGTPYDCTGETVVVVLTHEKRTDLVIRGSVSFSPDETYRPDLDEKLGIGAYFWTDEASEMLIPGKWKAEAHLKDAADKVEITLDFAGLTVEDDIADATISASMVGSDVTISNTTVISGVALGTVPKNAEVTAWLDGEQVARVISANGTFSLGVVSGAAYTIRVVSPGYTKADRSVVM